MKLGFVSARSVTRDADGLRTDAGMGRLIDALGERVPSMTVGLSVHPDAERMHDHRLRVPSRDFVALPWLPSVARGFRQAPGCLRAIAEVETRSDVVVVQTPFAAPLALVAPRRPRVYHVCGNIHGIVGASTYYKGARRVAAVGLARGIQALQQALVKVPGTRVVANGNELLTLHGGETKGRAIVSSSLYESDVASVRRKRPAGSPLRVLFVGYLRPEKGIDTLVDAFEALLRALPDAELEIVGASPAEERGVEGRIGASLQRLRERGRLRYAGPKPFGPELFQCLADADVLALPSKSEGTPRVLVEARACGCPVVATRVGGIPTSVDDGTDGLLVPPSDPGALANALKRVLTDASLRAALIDAGYARARRTTIEAMADSILEEATLAMGGRR